MVATERAKHEEMVVIEWAKLKVKKTNDVKEVAQILFDLSRLETYEIYKAMEMFENLSKRQQFLSQP